MHYSGRRSRRGRRRRSGSSREVTTPKPKLTFWQRVVAFFAGDTKKTTVAPPKPREKPAAATVAAPKEKISRKPELVEVTSPKLYVGNLSFDATESDLMAHCRSSLADFKCPTTIYIIDSIPRTATGKIQRRNVAAAIAKSS